MKPLVEQTHYDVLEVQRSAGPEEIERAYRLAEAAFAPDSLASYSMFAPEDAEHLRQRIETAYAVLSDPSARQDYDASLLGSEPRPLAALRAPLQADLLERVEGFDELADEGEVLDGAGLRRARLARGVELEQIAARTRIKAEYLRRIEEECFEALPAPVYVRGFVAAYARCLGLEGQGVAASYMERLRRAQREGRERSRGEG